MNTNEPTIIVTEETTLDEIIEQLDALGLLTTPAEIQREYRWYYDDKGNITATCTNPADAEMYGFTGKYLIVDADMYPNFKKYRIVDDKPELIKHDSGLRKQLEKSDTGFTVVKNNAALLLDDDEQYIDTEKYGYRNN